jgi:hypothetical protein
MEGYTVLNSRSKEGNPGMQTSYIKRWRLDDVSFEYKKAYVSNLENKGVIYVFADSGASISKSIK